MPSRSYALEEGGKKRLELSWSGFWSNFTVSLDGTPLGTLPRGQSLKDGQEFRLPDGSIIHIQLIQKPTGNYLEVLRDDKPLPGSDTNPRTILNTAAGVIYFFSGVNLLVGIIAVLFNVQWLQDYGIGFGSIIIGFIYLPLAYFTGEGSSIALLLAVLLYIVDGVAGIVHHGRGSPGLRWHRFPCCLADTHVQGLWGDHKIEGIRGSVNFAVYDTSIVWLKILRMRKK
jgi:hypothetical protein